MALAPGVVYENNDTDVDIDLVAPNSGAPEVITDAEPVVSLGSDQEGEKGLITAITNASPPVVTSAAHGLSNGAEIVIHGVKGSNGANVAAVVANVTANTFELKKPDGVTNVAAPGVYVSGGVWRKAVTNAFALVLTHSPTIDGRYNGTIPYDADVREGRDYYLHLYDRNLYPGLLLTQRVRGRLRSA